MNTGQWLSPCEAGNCIEVRHQPDGTVHLRNSAKPGTVIVGTAREWREFVAAIHSGAVA